MYDALSQVRSHVAAGLLDAPVTFPTLRKGTYTNRTAERKAKRANNVTSPLRVFPKEGLSPLGQTTLSGRPGSQLLFSMRYQAGSTRVQRGAKIGEVSRSQAGIGLWQERGGEFTRVSSNIILPTMLPEGGSSSIRLKVQLPSQEGTYQVTIGPWTYQLEVSGRPLRTTPSQSTFQRSEASSARSLRPLAPSRPVSSRTARSSISSRPSISAAPAISPAIRLRLTQTGPLGIRFTKGTANGADAPTVMSLRQDGTLCTAIADGRTVASGIVRFAATSGFLTVTDDKGSRRLRGTVECRVVDGTLMLINELPLEEYLWGLAEEPDTEPYEKQRAFAIAARTYAAYYMDPANRKFPGKPYDGSDSPAEFQAYKGADFETSHTMWVKAVKDTEGLTLTKDGKIIKPPYFSSDDGRTRTPEEAGWGKSFPFAEIYTSKPDPWCQGMQLRGHGVGMSGCGSEGQANEGKTAEQILQYYYPGTALTRR